MSNYDKRYALTAVILANTNPFITEELLGRLYDLLQTAGFNGDTIYKFLTECEYEIHSKTVFSAIYVDGGFGINIEKIDKPAETHVISFLHDTSDSEGYTSTHIHNKSIENNERKYNKNVIKVGTNLYFVSDGEGINSKVKPVLARELAEMHDGILKTT